MHHFVNASIGFHPLKVADLAGANPSFAALMSLMENLWRSLIW